MMSLGSAPQRISSGVPQIGKTQSQFVILKLSAGRAGESHARASCSKFSQDRTLAQSPIVVDKFCKFSSASEGKFNDAELSTASVGSVGLKRCYSRERCRRVICVVRCVSLRLLASYDDQETSSYHRFVEHAIEQSSQHMLLTPFPMKTKHQKLVAKDGKTVTNSCAFQSEKIRQFRAAEINGGRSIQVLNLVVFPSAAYDLPIFCADLVTFAKHYLIVLDLNPLYSDGISTQYKEKYISPLSPLWKKYHELLPWGGELTREAIEFFSPFVLWSKPIKEQSVDDIVFAAFKDYFNAWLDMVDKAEASNRVDEIYKNQEAQHRYMSWRSTKDPARNLLTRMYGEALCEEYMKEFLFAELENMGTKSFLDYFPQFSDQNGSIQNKRSMAGKAYPTRPWDESGNRISAPN